MREQFITYLKDGVGQSLVLSKVFSREDVERYRFDIRHVSGTQVHAHLFLDVQDYEATFVPQSNITPQIVNQYQGVLPLIVDVIENEGGIDLHDTTPINDPNLAALMLDLGFTPSHDDLDQRVLMSRHHLVAQTQEARRTLGFCKYAPVLREPRDGEDYTQVLIGMPYTRTVDDLFADRVAHVPEFTSTVRSDSEYL